MRKLLASLLFFSACSTAQANRRVAPQARITVLGSQIAIASAPAKIRAPYDVQVIRDNGEVLPTHAAGDRFYVQGNASERYIIRVTNPTANRVEAVVSVDGLDVVDGESGDLRKRGYIVPAYGDVRIEGFRTSAADVATFRFSSVDGSYAGKKGKARNVGVIAVAIFEEKASEQQQVIIGDAGPAPRDYDYDDDLVSASRGEGGRAAPRSSKSATRDDRATAPASVAPSGGSSANAPSVMRRPPSPMPPPPPYDGGDADDAAESESPEPSPDPSPTMPHTTLRPGLGTEFGEQRYSAASYTRFVRAEGKPVAIAELRYNDAAGLIALGIDVGPLPDAGEVMTRETADPFPGDGRFASPP